MRPPALAVSIALALVALVAACSRGEPEPIAEPPLKVGFLYVGPVGDGGWSWAHDQARKDLERTFPWVETAFQESVPEGAEAERVLAQYAERGYRLVFATSFGYMDSVLAVAERYPDVTFMHCSGYKRAPNVGTYFGRMEQAKYLAGLIAGRMTRSGRIGFVAPHPIPEVIRLVNGFALGVRAVHPQATVQVVWTNAWFDPGKEKEAAAALVDAGADVVATGADSVAPLQEAQARGVYAIGYDSDARRFAPGAFLTAPMWDWSVVYRDVVRRVRDGTWTSGDFNGGLETGVVRLAPLAEIVPPDVQTLVEQEDARIRSGSLDIFAGPIRDQDGGLRVPEGATIPDTDQLRMDWFVEGVQGTIPR
ncbi:MAG: BMP family ABC transporter substrate-binding protein [Deltaproteobacteria bacterium]|nr:BMP family ABC transporter substrate-binding protein [Deltaproteobacteria bacterium]